MKAIYILLISTFMATCSVQKTSTPTAQNIYDFKVKAIDGTDFDMASLKGKKVLIVNTASKCGYTPQYENLQLIYQQYGGDKFQIIGFPANNFREQEPGTNEEIAEFCRANYGVEFPMMSKISVTGDDIHPLYRWLTTKALNGVSDEPVTWNFQKFLIDEKGNLVAVAPPKEDPYSDRIINWIEGK